MPGPILDLDAVKSNHKGSTEDCFRITKGILDSLSVVRLGLITAKNSTMDNAWKLDKRNRWTTIKAMPDNNTRQSFHDQKHDIMDEKQVICHNLFTEMLGFIDVKWANDQLTADTKKTQAGYVHYPKSVHVYGECDELMTAMLNFLAVPANVTDLTAGGMPNTFVADATTAKTNLDTSNTDYTTALADSRQMTDDKMTALNLLYTDIQLMCDVAKIIWAQDKVQRNLFTYEVQYDIIHPPHQEVETIIVPKNGEKKVMNAVKDKDMTSLGTQPIDYYDYNLPVLPVNKHTINGGQTVSNTVSTELRFVNTTDKDVKIKLTRLVNK